MKNPSKSRNRGQGIVEFALAMPILLLMLLGIFEISRLVWIYNAVSSASREAARYGSSIGDNGSGTPRYLDCDGILARALSIGAISGIDSSDVTIYYDEGPGTTQIGNCPVAQSSIELGDRITVEIVVDFDPLQVLPIFDIPSFDISSMNSRTILKEVQVP